jgi:hypothetical protein
MPNRHTISIYFFSILLYNDLYFPHKGMKIPLYKQKKDEKRKVLHEKVVSLHGYLS